ncbi:unnamed protein product [Calypogeia fissa]
MTELGYTNDLPRPCNVAIQATIASIRAEEIHQAIQSHEQNALASQQEEEPGQFLMRLLGLDEWFSIYLLAQRSGIQMALQRLKEFDEILDGMEGEDAYDLQKAVAVARAMDVALTKVAKDTEKARDELLNPPPPPPVTPGPILHFFFPVVVPAGNGKDKSPLPALVTPLVVPLDPISTSSNSPSSSTLLSPNLSLHSLSSGSNSNIPLFCAGSPLTSGSNCTTPLFPAASPVASSSQVIPDSQSFDICHSIKDNPLLDLSWLTEDELIDMNVSMSVDNCSPIPVVPDVSEEIGSGEPYIPVLPPRHLEWECSKEDGCMWKIKNINNLAPISIDMWQAWGTVSDAEVLRCWERALNAMTLCDKAPIFVSHWPMTVFGSPKYKCPLAAGAKIKGKLDNTINRIKDHRSKMWNWHHPFFRCSCYFKPSCKGQLVWLDHAVWFMLHHLDAFFNASSIQGRLVMLIKFLSGDARRMVLDHIAFLYVREFIIEATQELIDHPEERFLTQYASTSGIRMVEAMAKPGMFSKKPDNQKTGNNKKRLNLNNQPSAASKHRGIYANPTVAPGVGRGGSSRAPPVPLWRNPNGPGNGSNRLGHGKALRGHVSPLQRRNIPF